MIDFIFSSLAEFVTFDFFVSLIIIVLLYLIALLFTKNNLYLLNISSRYKGKQRVHQGEVPRIGGIIIYLFLFYFALYFYDYYATDKLLLTLVCLLPVMLASICEDIFFNVHYKIRLLSLITSSFLLIVNVIETLPTVDHLFVISEFFSYPIFSKIFFVLCLVAFSNGCNFIDGMNGLLGFFILGSISSCLYLTYMYTDYIFFASPLIVYALIILSFLVLNFPWGKIFLGDSGAYLLSFLIGIWIIDFFGNFKNVSSWNAVLILFYPIAEVSYSFLRKIYQKKSPFYPDREHLHLKIYDVLNFALNRPKLSNNLTTVFLAIFWVGPGLLIPIVHDKQFMIFLSLIILFFTYLILNILIPKRSNYSSSSRKY